MSILSGAGSILTNPTVIKGAKSVLGGAVGGFIEDLFGGGGPNVANKLTKAYCPEGQVILQSSADQARALELKGINPCTGESMVAGAPYDPGYSSMPAGYEVPPMSVLSAPALPAPNGGGYPVAASAGGAGALEYTSTGKVRSVVRGGRRIATRRKAAAFIRKYGYEMSATAFGLSMQQLAKIILDDQMTPRRRRGLSYKQIQQAKRVIRTVKSMSSSLGSCTTRRAPARRKTCR